MTNSRSNLGTSTKMCPTGEILAFLLSRQAQLAGTELHLAGRGCVWFGFPWISPVGHIVPRFDRESKR